MNRTTLACLVLLPGFAFPAIAIAQTEAEPPPLSGPEVTEQRIDGVESGFSSMTSPGRMVQPVPMPVFRGAIAELAGEAAPEGARLTERQIQRLRALQREHRDAQQAFRRQHAAEFRELREAMGPVLAERLEARSDRPRPQQRRQKDRRPESAPERRRGAASGAMGGEADADQASGMNPDRPQRADRPLARADLTEQQRAAIARLRELQATAPGAEGLQTRIWAELTEPQQAHVQARIDEHRAEMTERRAAAYVERMMAQRAAAAAGGEAGGEAGDAGAPDRPARPRAAAVATLPPELRETLESLPELLRQRVAQLPPQRLERILLRLSRLTPDERAQVLRRIARDRRADRPRPAEDVPNRPDRSTPPPVEDVNVPGPDPRPARDG